MGDFSIIHLARAGAVIGKYSRSEVIALFESGELKESDHYWTQGMAGWAPLPELVKDEKQRLRALEIAKNEAERAEKEKLARDEERLRKKVEEAVAERLAQAREKSLEDGEQQDNNLGLVGGVLFVGGILCVLGAFSSRNKAQEASDGLTFLAGSRNYTQIDSSGYQAFAFVAGAVALLGLGLIVAGLSKKK